MSGVAVLADEAVNLADFEEDRLAGEAHAAQPALLHPAHDRGAMDPSEAEGRFGKREESTVSSGGVGRRQSARGRPGTLFDFPGA